MSSKVAEKVSANWIVEKVGMKYPTFFSILIKLLSECKKEKIMFENVALMIMAAMVAISAVCGGSSLMNKHLGF